MKACLTIVGLIVAVSMAAGCTTPMPAQEMDRDAPGSSLEETPPGKAPSTQVPPATSTAPQEPSAEMPVVPAGAETLVDLARADLAQQLGEKAEGITLLSVESAEFPDASLGVPEPDRMYAQVITPGYVIRLGVGDTVHTYHGSGDRVVLASED
jgi:hypothetical protein